MIDFLNDLWPGWRKKLSCMPYNQVYAIYKKEKERVAEAARRLETEQYICSVIAAEPHNTCYECSDCGGVFASDNPELQECRFCGSLRLRRNEL